MSLYNGVQVVGGDAKSRWHTGYYSILLTLALAFEPSDATIAVTRTTIQQVYRSDMFFLPMPNVTQSRN